MMLMDPGTPKTISKVADTGKNITSHFSGTTLFRMCESFPNAVIIKAGVLDDKEWPQQNAPKAEFFAGRRPNWGAWYAVDCGRNGFCI
jgi:hypothetical protein